MTLPSSHSSAAPIDPESFPVPEHLRRLSELHIPVTGFYPGVCYVISFDRESAQAPTEAEARILRSHLEYMITHGYLSPTREELLQSPAPRYRGTVTTVFHKRSETDWGYRRTTWRGDGPLFSPQPRTGDGEPLSLIALLDTKVNEIQAERWSSWKAEHPEIFGSAGANNSTDV